MATNLSVITAAYRIAGVLNLTEVPNAAEGADGLSKLNDMMEDWEENDGIELGYYPQTSLSATIPVEDKYLRGIKYNLAMAVAADNGFDLTMGNMKIASDTHGRLAKATTEEISTNMNHMPMGGGRSRYDINTE